MPELTLQERLQPSLLDRLRDDYPDERTEPPEKRVLSLPEVRRSVQRDIAWLFNATNLAGDVAGYSEVERSVLNYGIPDLAGFTVSSLDVGELERSIQQALQHFEPRLLNHSILLQADIDPDKMSHNTLVINIQCELWATPAPIQLLLRTELDFESGDVSLTEVTGGSR